MMAQQPSPTPAAPRPLPQPSLDNEEWWAGLRRHELLVQECPDCGKLTHLPQPMCPACRSLNRSWRRSTGKAPYPVVLVEMEEGFRVVGGIDWPHDKLREGLPVEADFEDVSEEVSLL